MTEFTEVVCLFLLVCVCLFEKIQVDCRKIRVDDRVCSYVFEIVSRDVCILVLIFRLFYTRPYIS